MLYKIYRTLTSFSAPVLNGMLEKRLANGKEDPVRINERRGEAGLPRPEGKVMWVHAASIGESISVLPLLDELQARLPEWKFMITTGTVTSANIMAQRLPKQVIHQFVPVDHPSWVKRFMDHWAPDAVLWMESDLWPNILHEISKRNIPTALLNARMSPASQKKWRHARGLSKKLMGTFNIILAGAREYVTVFQHLGGMNVRYVGNLKFGAAPLPVDPEKLATLKEMIGQRRLLSFLQTHPGDEKIAIDIFSELKKEFPDLLLLIAPRKNTRGAEIKVLATAFGMDTALRTRHEPITMQTDVYVADTIGEMGLWYTLSPMAVIGGSFVPHGGQNPLEGLHFNTAVFYGPHMFNFPEICAILEEAQAVERVETPEKLLNTLRNVLRYPSILSVKQDAAKEMMKKMTMIIPAYTDEIVDHLVRPSERS
jgi:3-deoxy-D-manno-octulosonic-acid transferase